MGQGWQLRQIREGEIVKEHRSQVQTEDTAPGEWMKQ